MTLESDKAANDIVLYLTSLLQASKPELSKRISADTSPIAATTPTPAPPSSPAYYISSSIGNDINPGTEALPFKTEEKGFAAALDGAACFLRYKCGDIFNDPGPLFRGGGGKSQTEQVVIESYGSGPPPVFQTLVFGTTKPLWHLTLRNIDFAVRGPQLLKTGGDITFDSLRVLSGVDGIVIQSDNQLTSIRVSRCVVTDLVGINKAQGIYVSGVNGLTLEYNVIDNLRNPSNILSHNVYIQNGCNGVVVRNNLFSRSSSHGIQMRSGGELTGNVFLNCPIAVSWGGGNTPEPSGVGVSMYRNIILGAGDIDAADPRGWAVYLSNVRSGSMSSNVIADGTGGDQHTMTLACGENQYGPTVGVLNFIVQGNVRRNWKGDVNIEPGPSSGTTITGMGERTDLTLVDIRPDTFLTNFLMLARAQKIIVNDYVTWALSRVGLS